MGAAVAVRCSTTFQQQQNGNFNTGVVEQLHDWSEAPTWEMFYQIRNTFPIVFILPFIILLVMNSLLISLIRFVDCCYFWLNFYLPLLILSIAISNTIIIFTSLFHPLGAASNEQHLLKAKDDGNFSSRKTIQRVFQKCSFQSSQCSFSQTQAS